MLAARGSPSQNTNLRGLAAPCARVLIRFTLENKRAQGKPGARCTRGLVCKMHKEMRTRAYRFSGGIPAFPARWCYGFLRALLGDRLSCHRRPADESTKLDASIGASGPHDFAVRLTHRSSKAHPRPPHLTARS